MIKSFSGLTGVAVDALARTGLAGSLLSHAARCALGGASRANGSTVLDQLLHDQHVQRLQPWYALGPSASGPWSATPTGPALTDLDSLVGTGPLLVACGGTDSGPSCQTLRDRAWHRAPFVMGETVLVLSAASDGLWAVGEDAQIAPLPSLWHRQRCDDRRDRTERNRERACPMPLPGDQGLLRPRTNGEVVATYTTYAEAQEAVDRLSDQKFPVETLTIVGTDLRLVETVLGRMSWGRAVLSGLAAGAWFGLFVGLLLGLFAATTRGWATLMLWGMVYGGLFGIVFGVISYALTRGRRDYVSTQSLVAGSYAVLSTPDQAAQARSLLGGS